MKVLEYIVLVAIHAVPFSHTLEQGIHERTFDWINEDSGNSKENFCSVLKANTFLLSFSGNETNGKSKSRGRVGSPIAEKGHAHVSNGAKFKVQNYPAQNLTLEQVVLSLDELAPLTLKEPWDNVGLLIEPPTERPIKTIFLTNDLTLPVLEEAIQKSSDLIISYHPPIFDSLKRITHRTWKEKIVGVCLEKGIGVYSPHTCWDAMPGGTADWLASAFQRSKSHPIVSFHPLTEDSGNNVKYYVEVRGPEHSSKKPFWGHKNTKMLLENDDTKVVFLNPKQKLMRVTTTGRQLPQTLRKISSYFSGSNSNIKTEEIADSNLTGVGRFITLEKPTPIKELVERVKTHLSLSNIQLALSYSHSLDKPVSKIALVPGSGASVLLNVAYADLFLTGEMSHHELLDANHNNISVILAQHSNTERGFLEKMAEKLTRKFNSGKGYSSVNVIISEVDKDPLTFV